MKMLHNIKIGIVQLGVWSLRKVSPEFDNFMHDKEKELSSNLKGFYSEEAENINTLLDKDPEDLTEDDYNSLVTDIKKTIVKNYDALMTSHNITNKGKLTSIELFRELVLTYSGILNFGYDIPSKYNWGKLVNLEDHKDWTSKIINLYDHNTPDTHNYMPAYISNKCIADTLHQAIPEEIFRGFHLFVVGLIKEFSDVYNIPDLVLNDRYRIAIMKGNGTVPLKFNKCTENMDLDYLVNFFMNYHTPQQNLYKKLIKTTKLTINNEVYSYKENLNNFFSDPEQTTPPILCIIDTKKKDIFASPFDKRIPDIIEATDDVLM